MGSCYESEIIKEVSYKSQVHLQSSFPAARATMLNSMKNKFGNIMHPLTILFFKLNFYWEMKVILIWSWGSLRIINHFAVYKIA
jgi:hypothetical protein